MKSFKVRFYQSHTGEAQTNVASIFLDLIDKQKQDEPSPQIGEGIRKHEIRELSALSNRNLIQGVLALVRDDAPHIREEDGGERKIKLKEKEGLLEKNYFLYYPTQNLLVWQVNGNASHVSQLGRYLTEICGEKIEFLDILQQDSYQRLQDGVINKMQFRVAKMQNAENIAPDNWEASAFELMSGIDGTSIEVTVSTPRIKRGLAASTAEIVKRMMGREDVKALKVDLDGEKEPIDLLADRIYDSIRVNMAGRYPIPEEVIHELAEAKDRQRDALEASLGVGNKVLE